MLNDLLWLLPFLFLGSVSGQSHTPVADLGDYVSQTLNELQVKLDRAPKEAKPKDDVHKVYHQAIWDEPAEDFYHPHSFNILDGNRQNLVVDSIFEDKRRQSPGGLPAVDITRAEVAGVSVLAWSSRGIVSVQWTRNRQDSMLTKELPGVQQLDHLAIFNPSTNQLELYLLVLYAHLGQKIALLRINLEHPNITTALEFPVDPDIVLIRHVEVRQSKRHLIVVGRYLSSKSPIPSMTSSDVIEATFINGRLFLYKLDSILTSGAADIEPFTINDVTYVAIANSHCAYSDIFVFDADVNGFHLYQRLQLLNATDLEYFSIGYRHFVAGIGIDRAIIFEWEGEGLVFLQEFPLEYPSSDRPDPRRWHSLRTGFPDQVLLLLVRSSKSVVFVTWSKLEGRFLILDSAACLSWSPHIDTMGINANSAPPQHQDIFGAMIECSWAGNQCIGITEMARPDGKKYALELELGGIQPADAYGFTYWKKEKQPDLSCFMADNAIGRGSIVSYRIQDATYAVIPFETYTATVVFILRRVRTELFSARASLMQSLSNSQQRIEAQELRLQQLNSTDKPLTVVTVNGNERIVETVTFDTDVQVSNDLVVQELKFSNSRSEAKMGQYEGILADLDRQIREIVRRLGDAIPIDKAVSIDHDLSFLTIEVDGKIVSKNGAHIGKINNVDVKDFISNAVTANHQGPIYGQKAFTGPVNIHGNMIVNGPVAGHNFPDDILTTNTQQDLKGLWKFDRPVSVLEEATVHGQLNGVDMNKLVVNRPGYPNVTRATYPARMHFLDNIVVEGDIIAPSVDGIDLAGLAPTIVTLKDHQVITAPKEFGNNVHVIADVNLHKTINGFILPFLDASVVKSDQQVDITGHKIFKDNVFVDESIFVNGFVKEFTIPDDFVLNNTTATISGKKTFRKQLAVKQNIFVDEFVSGIPPSALVTLYSEQTIPDLKIFTGGIEFHNLDVEGKIDGLTVQELVEMHSPNYQPPISPTEFDAITLTSDLSSVDSINGYSVNDLHKDTVIKGDTEVIIQSPKIFENNAAIKRNVLDIQRINNLDPRTDFVNADSPQIVTGKKVFRRRVVFTKGLTVNGLLDGVNVTDFGSTAVTLSTPQYIGGNKIFKNGIKVTGSTNVGVIDSIAIPDQLLLPHTSRPIVGKKTFTKGLRGKKLFVDRLNLQGNLNRVSWLKFMSGRVTLLSPQDIIAPMNFVESVTIRGNLDVTGAINNVNVRQLVTDAMRKSVPQTVTGPKTVLGLVQGQSIVTTRQGLDGVNMTKLNTLIIPVDNGIISNSYSFPELRAVAEIKVNGQLGPLNLDTLIKDSIVKIGPPQHITALKTFNHGVTIAGGLKVDKVNNLDLLKSILSRKRVQQVTGTYELIGQVIIEKDLLVFGKLNNLNLAEFSEQVMKTDQTTTTSGLTFEDNLNVEFNLDVETTINDVILPELVEDAVLKNGPAKIVATKTFTGKLTVAGNVDVLQHINGFSLSAFASNLVFVMGEQVITGPKYFTNVKLDKDLMVAGNLILKGKVENVSLPDLLNNAVLLHDEHTIHGHKIFKAPMTAHNLVVMEALNSIRFPQDVVTINSPQTVNGLKHFHHIVVETNVNGERVNDQNLHATAQDTLLLIGDQQIKGTKVLQRPATFKAPVDVSSHTCELNFGEQVVNLDSPQEITGEKTIHHMTVTKLAQINKINGNDLGPLTELWRIRDEESVEMEHHFMGRTKFNHPINIMAPAANVDVLKTGVQELDTMQKQLVGGLNAAQKHCVGYSEIMNPLSHAAVKLHHFDDLQSLDVESSTGFTSWSTGNQLHMIARHDGSDCQKDTLFVWNEHDGIFEKIGPLGTPGKSVHWHNFIYKNQQFLAIADGDSSCGSTSKIWRYNVDALLYEVHCHLNVSASQIASVEMGEDFFLVVGHTDVKSQVLRMDLNQNCKVDEKWDIFPESSMVTVVQPLHLIIFSNIHSIFSEVYRLTPQKEFVLVQRLETPGIKDIVTASTTEHYLILNRKQYPSRWTKPMDMVQIYKLSDRSGETMTLIKEIPSEMLREVLDLDTFNFGPHNEPYLAILHKKTGVMITPLFGLLTYDDIKLPMPQAKTMHALTIKSRLYIVLNQVDPRRNAHVYRGYAEGTNLRDVIKC